MLASNKVESWKCEWRWIFPGFPPDFHVQRF